MTLILAEKIELLLEVIKVFPSLLIDRNNAWGEALELKTPSVKRTNKNSVTQN